MSKQTSVPEIRRRCGKWRHTGCDGLRRGRRPRRPHPCPRRNPGGKPLLLPEASRGSTPNAARIPAIPAGDIKEQTERTLEAHKKNLEAIGTSLENVLKVTVFLADPKNERSGMNEVYAKFFPKDAPARSAIGVQFPDEVTRVEIELVAWIPDK